MTPRQEAHSLISLFQKKLAETGKSEMIDRGRARWASEDLIASYGLHNCKVALDYYFRIKQEHSWQYFVAHCGSMLTNIQRQEQDKQLRKQAAERAQRWLIDG